MRFDLKFAEALDLAYWSGAVIANSAVPNLRYRVKQDDGKQLQMRHIRKGVVSTIWGKTPASLLPCEVRAKWRVVKVKKARNR